MNELFNRVNKMGVSEVAIRRVGNGIVLDFPGSQALRAADLVQASSMYFHVVNEKFSPQNPQLSDAVQRFLQEVWNEAVVTNRTDSESINAIAWKHLCKDKEDGSHLGSDAARTLYENGLRLQPPSEHTFSGELDESFSKIAVMRDERGHDKRRQTNPLLIVFRNYALEGSSLANIRASYDPSKGNFLSFEVATSVPSDGKKSPTNAPRVDFAVLQGKGRRDSYEGPSRGQGWRMAVILNDTVISAPTLSSALSDSAMISGSFSQREVNQLAADLKAGSLTFTPHIFPKKMSAPNWGKPIA